MREHRCQKVTYIKPRLNFVECISLSILFIQCSKHVTLNLVSGVIHRELGEISERLRCAQKLCVGSCVSTGLHRYPPAHAIRMRILHEHEFRVIVSNSCRKHEFLTRISCHRVKSCTRNTICVYDFRISC